MYQLFQILRVVDLIFYFLTGETEDDAENNKKELRPKRMKNVSGPVEASLRPASAASVTSLTSEDRRDMEDIRRMRDHEGKLTPDSQRSEDNKSQ